MNADKELDVRPLNCPMPVLLARRALDAIDAGKVLKVTASGSAAAQDLLALVRQTSNELLQSAESDGEYTLFIRKQ